MIEAPAYAEEAVLGGVLLDNTRFHEVAPLLSVEHFTNPFRKRLWGAIRDRVLAGEPADAVTVGETLPSDFADIVDLATHCITGPSTLDYAGIVRENWRRREAGVIGQRLLASLKAKEAGAVDEAIGSLIALNSTVTECEYTGKQAMVLAWNKAQEAYANGGVLPGITTGMRSLDELLGGFHDSDLTLIGARPAMGKTAFMVNLAEAAAAAGYPVGLVSAEQPAIQIGLRRLSLASKVAATALRSGQLHDEDWAKLQAGVTRVAPAPMWIYDRSALTLDELVGVARKWRHTHGIKALFLDYAQRVTVPGAERITEVSAIARGLKNLARNLNIPVVALGQVKAAVDARPDKRPNAGDLANSDELTREADQILMLYRDEVYNRDTADRGIAELLVEKNRHGPTGFIRLKFFAETMQFADLAREEF